MLQLETKQINPKLKFYIMKKRQQKKQGMLFCLILWLLLYLLSYFFICFISEQETEAERLRQEKQEREQILTELNKLNGEFSILEKNLSESREKKDQLLKELNVINKILKQTEIAKIQQMNNNRFISRLKCCKSWKVPKV